MVHVQSCCFAYKTYGLFDVLVAVHVDGSWSERPRTGKARRGGALIQRTRWLVCVGFNERARGTLARRVEEAYWLFTIYKKIPEILVGNFRSLRTVSVVCHLLKISWLSHRARLDSSYSMKLVTKLKKLVNGKRISIRNVLIGKTGLPFQNFRLSREFSSGTNQKIVYHLHPKRNFWEFVVNGEQPILSFSRLLRARP